MILLLAYHCNPTCPTPLSSGIYHTLSFKTWQQKGRRSFSDHILSYIILYHSKIEQRLKERRKMQHYGNYSTMLHVHASARMKQWIKWKKWYLSSGWNIRAIKLLRLENVILAGCIASKSMLFMLIELQLTSSPIFSALFYILINNITNNKRYYQE